MHCHLQQQMLEMSEINVIILSYLIQFTVCSLLNVLDVNQPYLHTFNMEATPLQLISNTAH